MCLSQDIPALLSSLLCKNPPGSQGGLTKEHFVQQSLSFGHLPLPPGWKHLEKPGLTRKTAEQNPWNWVFSWLCSMILGLKRNSIFFVRPPQHFLRCCLGKKSFLLYVQISFFSPNTDPTRQRSTPRAGLEVENGLAALQLNVFLGEMWGNSHGNLEKSPKIFICSHFSPSCPHLWALAWEKGS